MGGRSTDAVLPGTTWDPTSDSTSGRSLYVEEEISPVYVKVRATDGDARRERVMKKESVVSNYRLHRPEDNGRATPREPVAKAPSGKKKMHPADIRRADHLIVETLEEPAGAPPAPDGSSSRPVDVAIVSSHQWSVGTGIDGRRFFFCESRFVGLIRAALEVVDVWVGMNVGTSFPDGSTTRVLVDVGELLKIDGAISALTDSIGDAEL